MENSVCTVDEGRVLGKLMYISLADSHALQFNLICIMHFHITLSFVGHCNWLNPTVKGSVVLLTYIFSHEKRMGFIWKLGNISFLFPPSFHHACTQYVMFLIALLFGSGIELQGSKNVECPGGPID